MKNLLPLGILILIFSISTFAFGYYNNYFKGVWPAVLPPKGNISTTIKETGGTNITTNGAGEAVNNTEFPLQIPPGFTLSVFAENLGGAPRVLLENQNGIILASLTKEGKVVALIDSDDDGTAEAIFPILENLNRPHGLAIKGGVLYIAESNQVTSYDYDKETQVVTNKRKVLDLPDGGNHFTRTITFKDDLLLVSTGSSCNACVEKDARRAAITAVRPDGTSYTFANGLRNSVFMAINPKTKDLWATEMGRDLLGDDIPPDEINIIEEGNFYGWPYCYDNNIQDKEFDSSPQKSAVCQTATPPIVKLQAHSAPLGLAFIDNANWPTSWQGDLLVAYHGSWNRTVPTGYKLVKVDLGESEPIVTDFITGWFTSPSGGLASPQALGRPVDIIIGNDGTAYISDDKAQLIYSLTPPKLDQSE